MSSSSVSFCGGGWGTGGAAAAMEFFFLAAAAPRATFFAPGPAPTPAPPVALAPRLLLLLPRAAVAAATDKSITRFYKEKHFRQEKNTKSTPQKWRLWLDVTFVLCVMKIMEKCKCKLFCTDLVFKTDKPIPNENYQIIKNSANLNQFYATNPRKTVI